MSNLAAVLWVIRILVFLLGAIALALAPLTLIARRVLVPIDQVAKFRQAPVRFSIGDFLCLFLAIQIPLAAVHRFIGNDTREAYWVFTAITWLVAPVVWYAGAHTLSKARVTASSHRFVFLGLIMPLVYYGLIPFTVLGIAFLTPLVGQSDLPLRWMIPTWFVLVGLFYISGTYVRWMLRKAPSDVSSMTDEQYENKLLRVAMLDSPTATMPHGSQGIS